MTAEDAEHFNFTEEACPHDCKSCPYGRTAIECQDLYEEFIATRDCEY